MTHTSKIGCNGALCPLLVVDDEALICSALRRTLRSSGFAIHTFTSPLEALDFARGNEVHVVLSDFRMPDMNGVEFLKRMRDIHPLAQRVMLTGYADPRAVEEAVNHSEVFRFVSKPWDDQALKLILRAAADEAHTRSEIDRLAILTRAQNEALKDLTRTLEEKVEARTREIAVLEAQWALSLDAIEDPLALFCPERGVIRSNLAFQKRFASHQEQVLAEIERVRHSGNRRHRPLVIDRRSFRLKSHDTGDGTAVCAFTDVTGEEAFERRMRHHEKMVAMGQLAGGVAHEINSPLAGILSFAQILARDADRSQEDVEALGMIENAARRAARIVDSLLRFSRVPSQQQWALVDLGRVVEDARLLLEVQLRGKQITLVNEAPKDSLFVHGSSGELHQVLVNLLRNASQAIGEGPGTIVVKGERRGTEMLLSVSDTGHGIPPEVLDRIFDPFFTTKEEGAGTGLGLSICYRIAESHGGRIEVESEPGRGTRFRLFLPAEPETAE